MIAERIPRALLEEASREGYRRQFPTGPRPGAPPANARATLHLLVQGDVIRIPYRGRVYELGHVSFEDGIRLVEARAAIVALEDVEPDEENTAAYLGALRTVVALAPRYLLPMNRLRRLFWRLRLRRNPFRSATDAEVGHLLGFFLGCRTRSSVQYPPTAERAPAQIS